MPAELLTDCKCECANCGALIEYRSSQAGEIVQCPKCGTKSELPEPVKLMLQEAQGPPAPEFKNCLFCGHQLNFWDKKCPACEAAKQKKTFRNRVAISISAVAMLMVSAILYKYFNKPPPPPPQKPGHMFIAEAQPAPTKSLKELLPRNFTLERKHNETTGVAVGDILNTSDHVHHHVRANVDLLDKNGVKIGTVTDDIIDLGANQTWHFVAEVTDSKAMSVRFASFKEEE